MVLTAPIALWALPVSDLAGVARHTLDVARQGIPGWRLVFLTPPGPLPAALRDAGAAVLEQPFGPGHGLRASVASLRHAVRTLRPQLVQSHLSYADVVAAVAVGRPTRLVTTEHGIARDDLVYHRSAAQARLMAAVHTARLRRFDAIVAVSRATADALADKWHPRRSVTVIPNGVDPVGHAAPTPGLRVLSLARLAPEKRIDALLDGFAALRRDHSQAKLTVAGAGELLKPLQARTAALGLSDAVSFPGFVDPQEAMAGHDVVAMLSVWENCSYALLDAAVAGMGVVASDVGGNPEILPERCLVAADDPDAVAHALAEQGLRTQTRPGLDEWPDVAAMCDDLAHTYAGVAGDQ